MKVLVIKDCWECRHAKCEEDSIIDNQIKYKYICNKVSNHPEIENLSIIPEWCPLDDKIEEVNKMSIECTKRVCECGCNKVGKLVLADSDIYCVCDGCGVIKASCDKENECNNITKIS